MGMERTPNKSQHTNLTLEKKIIPLLLPGFELATFRSRVRRSDNKLFRIQHVTTHVVKKQKQKCFKHMKTAEMLTSFGSVQVLNIDDQEKVDF